jgi:hypothetical protein
MPTTYPNKELLDTKRDEGVIEPARLATGTTLLLESNAQVYELSIREGGLISAVGCGKRGFLQQIVEFVGSLDQRGTLFAGLIVKDYHMVLKIDTGRYVTGCIRSASIRGPGYSYELWEN